MVHLSGGDIMQKAEQDLAETATNTKSVESNDDHDSIAMSANIPKSKLKKMETLEKNIASGMNSRCAAYQVFFREMDEKTSERYEQCVDDKGRAEVRQDWARHKLKTMKNEFVHTKAWKELDKSIALFDDAASDCPEVRLAS